MGWQLVDVAASSPWAWVGVALLVMSPRILRSIPPVVDACSRSRLTRAIVMILDRTDGDAADGLLDLLKHLNNPNATMAGPARRLATSSPRRNRMYAAPAPPNRRTATTRALRRTDRICIGRMVSVGG